MAMAMAGGAGDRITHRFIYANGIKMHIAEQGSGPIVLLLHGFPELWYSWRHQMPVLAASGYRAVAPDLRGYGQTDAPAGSENYTSFHIVGDIIGLLDALGEEQAFVVAHDWGAVIAWDLCLFRPDRVKALIALSVAFRPREDHSMLAGMRKAFGEGFYFCRFQEPGRAEADFARFDAKTVMKKFLLMTKSESLLCPQGKELCDILDVPEELPPWISDQEIDFFAREFARTGFTGGLNYYRATELTWELKAPWRNQIVRGVPAAFITGDRDPVTSSPAARTYIHGLAAVVPNLMEVAVVPAGHFVQQENPTEVNRLLLKFLGACKP